MRLTLLLILAAFLLPATASAAPHTSTGPVPPPNVKFGHYTLMNAVLGTALGEVVITDVPAYCWRDGCGPTAVGMVVGWWDAHGWPELLVGDPQQMISSHGTVDASGHYEDYSLPMETTYAVAPDKSELPIGDEHPADSVADFMHTSWSVDGLWYGYSYSDMVGPGFAGYVRLKYPDSFPVVTQAGGANLTFALVQQEIDSGRPLVFMVDGDGDGSPDHFVTVIGYRDTNGYPEYACWDTWEEHVIRWQAFRPASSSYQWGVYRSYSFSVGGSVPPDPTPTPTPTVTPADVTPPVTTISRVKRGTYFLTATDAGSGVAQTYYRLGDGWLEGTSFKLTRGTVRFYSVDRAGNVETVNSFTR